MNHAHASSNWQKFLQSVLPSRRASTSTNTQRLLRLHVYAPHDHGRVRVGTLTVEGDEFVFVYDTEFATNPTVRPLVGFSQLDKVYRSNELWPFFKTRIPPVDRDDVRVQLQQSNVEASDTLRVLGTVARAAIASPYVFELEGDRARGATTP